MRIRPCLLLTGLLMTGTMPFIALGQNKTLRLPVKNQAIYLLNVQSYLNIQPGDTLLIPKGQKIRSFKMSGLHGTQEKPVVIMQEDTADRIGGYKAYAFAMVNATFVKLYHIHVDGAHTNEGIGIHMGRGCSDFTIENCSSDNNGVGFQCKVTPFKNDPGSVYPTPMKNIRIENCSASNNKAEGFYIGYSAGAKDTGLKAILIDGLYMKNIKAINNGWDGIQITRAKNFTGKNFYVSGYGASRTFGQNSGIAIQTDVTGSLDGFEVSDGEGAGLTIFARDKLHLQNGKLKNVGKTSTGDGIYVNDFPTGYSLPPLQLYLENITIDGYSRFPVNVVNRFKTMKPGSFKNVQFKNGASGKGIADFSGSAKTK
jgi:hypothetical protein